ncbi:hypothetical protein BH11PLA2_BH11PLA2_31260 [soil metagenome]
MRLFSTAKTRGQITWGDATIPQDLANYHFLAAGSTGSGKSTLLRVLLRSVLPDVLVKEYDTRALIYDAKTEVYPDLASLGLQNESIILNPFDSRCTAWDIGRDIRDEAQAQELAAVMVPPGEGANKYFYDASRLMLKTAALALIKLRGQKWSFRDLLLACANITDLKAMTEKANLPGMETIEDFLNPSKEARSVRMTLTVENSAYNVIADAWERARNANRLFSIHEWIAGKGPQILILGSAKQARTALNTINRLIVQRVQQIALGYTVKNDRTGRRTWVFLDEFPALGAIPHLEEVLTEGRSRGICTVLGFQHIAHVRRWYGPMAEALVGQCLHQAYFRSNDAEMAEWCARHFGLLLTMEDEPDKPKHIKTQSPAATMNDFLFLEPATEKTGYQCIIRSSTAVLPSGPRMVHGKPRPELAGVNAGSSDALTARFMPWETKLELQPWNEAERIALYLSPEPLKGDAIPLPTVDNPVLIRSSALNS